MLLRLFTLLARLIPSVVSCSLIAARRDGPSRGAQQRKGPIAGG